MVTVAWVATNFKLVKGILQSVLRPNIATTSCLLEVIVIPKPAGPRHVLTALHMASIKPTIDPFFSPIAMSPISPGLYPAASYFHQKLACPQRRCRDLDHLGRPTLQSNAIVASLLLTFIDIN